MKLTVMSLSELKFVSPDSLMTRDGDELTVSKKTLKIMMNSLGMVGDKFSKDLYDIDENAWSELIAKQCAVNPFYTDSAVIIANDEIINAVSNNNREWLQKLESIIKSFEKEEGTQVQTLREADGFSVLCLRGSMGFVLDVSIPDKQITAKNVYLADNEFLCLSPSLTVNCKIDSGVNTSDLFTVLGFDALMGNDSPDFYADYIRYIGSTRMSYADALDALKAAYGIKVKSDIPSPDDCLTAIEDPASFTEQEMQTARDILNEIYSNAYHYIPKANKLETHLKFIEVKYGSFLQALSSRYLSGNLDFSVLDKFSGMASQGNLDDTIVSRVFGRKEQI